MAPRRRHPALTEARRRAVAEGIEFADAHLANVAVPTYSETVLALRALVADAKVAGIPRKPGDSLSHAETILEHLDNPR